MTAINPKDGEEYYTPMDFIDIKKVIAQALLFISLAFLGFAISLSL
jgi:hypothetical protein